MHTGFIYYRPGEDVYRVLDITDQVFQCWCCRCVRMYTGFIHYRPGEDVYRVSILQTRFSSVGVVDV